MEFDDRKNDIYQVVSHAYDSDMEFEHLVGDHPWKFKSEARLCSCWHIVGGKATSDQYLLGSLKKRQCSLNVHLCVCALCGGHWSWQCRTRFSNTNMMRDRGRAHSSAMLCDSARCFTNAHAIRPYEQKQKPK